jgi:hypothetical protein
LVTYKQRKIKIKLKLSSNSKKENKVYYGFTNCNRKTYIALRLFFNGNNPMAFIINNPMEGVKLIILKELSEDYIIGILLFYLLLAFPFSPTKILLLKLRENTTF